MHPLLSPVLRTLVASRRYAIEAFFAAILMFCIELFLVALEHPAYPAHQLIGLPWMRRACMGVLMGTIIALICISPWGKRSGAHMNPAITLAFWTLDKIKGVDAIGYVLMQFLGALAGTRAAARFTQGAVAHPQIDYATTTIGDSSTSWAFVAEFGMSFLLMGGILLLSMRPKLSQYTPAVAGALIASFITLEAPLSGMSINPTRTLTAGMMAGHLEYFWLYCLAPVTGMLAAAGVSRLFRRRMAMRRS